MLEAMAAATPVVATSVGGVPKLVLSGTTGLLLWPRRRGDSSRRFEALRDEDARLLRLSRSRSCR